MYKYKNVYICGVCSGGATAVKHKRLLKQSIINIKSNCYEKDFCTIDRYVDHRSCC